MKFKDLYEKGLATLVFGSTVTSVLVSLTS